MSDLTVANQTARRLIQSALARSMEIEEGDRLLDLVFEDPREAARLLGWSSGVEFTDREVRGLQVLSTESFAGCIDTARDADAVKAIVEGLERMDMPEVER